MDTSIAIPIAAAIFAVAFALVAYFLLRSKVRRERAEIRVESDRVLAEAKKLAEGRLREASIEAKEKVLAAQVEFDKAIQVRRQEVASLKSGSLRRKRTSTASSPSRRSARRSLPARRRSWRSPRRASNGRRRRRSA